MIRKLATVCCPGAFCSGHRQLPEAAGARQPQQGNQGLQRNASLKRPSNYFEKAINSIPN